MIMTIFSQAKLKRKFPYQILGIFSTKNLELTGKVSCGRRLSMCEKCVWTTLTALRTTLGLPLPTPCHQGWKEATLVKQDTHCPLLPATGPRMGDCPGESQTPCLGVGSSWTKSENTGEPSKQGDYVLSELILQF